MDNIRYGCFGQSEVFKCQKDDFFPEVESLFSNLCPLAYEKIGKPTPTEV